MKVQSDIAHWLQRTLLGLNGEDSGLGYMIDGVIDSVPEYTNQRWQLGVDTIYRALTCDLIAVDKVFGADAPSFLRTIQTISPYGDAGIALWNGTLIYGTERLSKLVESYFPLSEQSVDELNPSFIEGLEKILAENGVSWSDKPLLPVSAAVSAAPSTP